MTTKPICDKPECEETARVRVYLSIQKIYDEDGFRVTGNNTRGMGGADLCLPHFEELCTSNTGFYRPDMWLANHGMTS